MATTRRAEVAGTDGTTNLDVPVTGDRTLDEMESLLLGVASHHGTCCSHVMVSGTRRCPGIRHWHVKQDQRATGCLDVMYWPAGPSIWVSMRTNEPA